MKIFVQPWVGVRMFSWHAVSRTRTVVVPTAMIFLDFSLAEFIVCAVSGLTVYHSACILWFARSSVKIGSKVPRPT